MSGIFTSDWIVPILAFLIIGFNLVLTKINEIESPAFGRRTVQVILIVLSGLMIYSLYSMFAGAG